MVKYKLNNVTYEVLPCTLSDVNTHYMYVKDLTTDIDKELYIERMKQSIDQGHAYQVLVDTVVVGFIYTIIESKSRGEGVSIWGTDSIAFIPLLKEAFTNYPRRRVDVYPHNNDVSLFKSIVDINSIREYHAFDKPITIWIDKAYNKFEKLYNKLGFTCG